jgi:hypothetical protein
LLFQSRVSMCLWILQKRFQARCFSAAMPINSVQKRRARGPVLSLPKGVPTLAVSIQTNPVALIPGAGIGQNDPITDAETAANFNQIDRAATELDRYTRGDVVAVDLE